MDYWDDAQVQVRPLPPGVLGLGHTLASPGKISPLASQSWRFSLIHSPFATRALGT